MGNNEVSINLIHIFVFPISRLPRHLENQFCTIFNISDQAKFRKKQYLYSRIKIGRLIYKRVNLYHMITNKLHSISTKMIPIHTFVNAFLNFNPRIHVFSFLNCEQAGVLKTVQHLLGCFGSRENEKTKVCSKLFKTLKLTI